MLCFYVLIDFDFFSLFLYLLLVSIYIVEQEVAELFIIYQNFVLNGRERCEYRQQELVLKLFRVSQLQDVVQLCTRDVAVMLLVNFLDVPHDFHHFVFLDN